jgi:hypothetical protein
LLHIWLPYWMTLTLKKKLGPLVLSHLYKCRKNIYLDISEQPHITPQLSTYIFLSCTGNFMTNTSQEISHCCENSDPAFCYKTARVKAERDTAVTHPLLCDEAITDVQFSSACWNWCSGQVSPMSRRERKQSALTAHKKLYTSRLMMSRCGDVERLLGEDRCLGDLRYTEPAAQETGGDFVCDPHSHRVTQKMWAPFNFLQLGRTA